MTRTPQRRLLASTIIAVLAASTGQVQASGFAIIEQSVTGLGNAFAGGSASAEDASTVFYNPAGLARLTGTQYVAGIQVIAPSTKFSGSAALFNPAPPPTTVPVSGGNGGDAGKVGVVPNLYYSRALDRHWTFGLGVNAPFGLATSYDPNWVGRYLAIKSELKTLNINPSIAYKLSDQLSLGFGVSAQYATAELTNQVPVGTDNVMSVKGNDWAWGYNLGLLYQFTDRTRFGFAYRSKIDHTLKGTVSFTVPSALTPNTPARAGVTTPETASFSIFHRLDSRWDIMADATWTRWDRFQQIDVIPDQAVLGKTTLTLPEGWKNSWRYSVGANYHYNNRWTLRGGLAYDETPIPTAEARTPRIPGNDRKWISIGASYQSSPNLAFDIGYAHLFVSDTPINNTNSFGTITGTYKSHVDILSAQLRWTFD